MAKLSDEQLHGCRKAFLMAHGFPTEMLEGLVGTGLAKTSPDEVKISRRRRKIVCFQITDAGREAAAEH
jgi:hypothetical protein